MRRVLPFVAALALAAAAQAQAPTFSGEVVRIFQQNCQSCHHPGDIAPFSLMDYQSARPYADRIKSQVTARIMPPWKPLLGEGDFLDARVLTSQQIDTIARWADAGTPQGNPNDLPPPLTFPDGWVLGTPDLVLRMDEFTVPSGSDLYRCFSLPTNFTENRYISGVEVRPGNRSLVHHVLLFGDPSGQSRALDERDAGPGYTCFGGPGFDPDPAFFNGFVPGLRPSFLSPGLGQQLRAGSRIAMQVHYHPHNGGGTDLTQVGLYFSRTPVDKIVRVVPLLNTTFVIPAGNPWYEVRASVTTPPLSLANAHIVAIAPHMHLLGREIKVQATYPGNRVVPLIHIGDWDFNWQGLYTYRQAVPFPGGSTAEFFAHYDNSANNLNNPNSPPRDVRWGEATTDEMALVFLMATLDSEHLGPPQVSAGGLVNAASYVGGASAPGAIVSLFGSGFGSAWESAATLPLPRRLAGGTRVTVGGVEAPLFYVSPSQINFQIPFEVSTATATVTVTRGDDGQSQSMSLTLANAQPGIFTYGTGSAAALNAQTGALVSAENPVGRGEWVAVYASGLGRVLPAAQSGAPPQALSSTAEPVTVLVGNSRAEVNFSGLAPNFAGLYQVNFRVPADVAPGAEVPLKLSVSGLESNVSKLAIR